MTDAQALEQHSWLPWFIVMVPVMVIASTLMSLAGA